MGAIKQLWLNKGGVVVIVSLKVLKKICPSPTTPDITNGQFVWHTDQGDVFIKNNWKGMPCLDIREPKIEATLLFIHTVRGNMEGYTWHKAKEACAVREAQSMLGNPTDQEFLGMVCYSMILNRPVTPTAVQNANQIICLNLTGVRG